MIELEERVYELFGCPGTCNYQEGGKNCRLYPHWVPWQDQPVSTKPIDPIFSSGNFAFYGFHHVPKNIANEIDNLIKQADTSVCLTSEFEYIRKAKEWFLKNESR